MSFALLNPWMLAGLAGIGLPLLVHLLSRKKYDVMPWGAMQFLELGRSAKRRVQLEEILLMLLRMGLLALLAIALARPWLSGSLVAPFAARPPSDIVVVLDSSYSTDWRGKAQTPHAAAVNWIDRFLDDLPAGGTVALLDARDQVAAPVPVLTRNVNLIRQALQDLPAPSGSSHLNEAIIKGMQLLNTGSNLSRQVIVVTDSQSLAWAETGNRFWLQIKELRQQASIPADIWVVGMQRQQKRRSNFSVDQIELSRELTVVDFPLQFRTTVRNSGAQAGSNRRVFLEVDGQRLADRSVTVRIESNGQATAEFEHRFRTPGSHRISIGLEADSLPADDRSDAAVVIADALPALLIDGRPNPDPARSEMFFAAFALSPSGNRTPWVQARTVVLSELRDTHLASAQVAILGNAARLSAEQLEMLQGFVDRGNGLGITLGDAVDTDWYNTALFDDGNGLLPGLLVSHQTAATAKQNAKDVQPVTILGESLRLPWVSGFQAGADDGFLDARFSDWFRVTPAVAVQMDREDAGSGGQDRRRSRESAVVAARLTNGEPLIVTRRYGRGQVAILTSSIDADWNTLPAKPDYVAFLHELVFHLAAAESSRNVETSTPLVLGVEPDDAETDWVVVDSEGNESTPVRAGDELNPMLRFDGTRLPGIYEFRRLNREAGATGAGPGELFVVNCDRSESDLTQLSDETWGSLTGQDRLRRMDQPEELFAALNSDSARVEIWQLLLLGFCALLTGEVFMTRRLVRGGHASEGVIAEE
ncbi:MAG: BatA domain-containing protein [Planctomycetaceae bacterium]